MESDSLKRHFLEEETAVVWRGRCFQPIIRWLPTFRGTYASLWTCRLLLVTGISFWHRTTLDIELGWSQLLLLGYFLDCAHWQKFEQHHATFVFVSNAKLLSFTNWWFWLDTESQFRNTSSLLHLSEVKHRTTALCCNAAMQWCAVHPPTVQASKQGPANSHAFSPSNPLTAWHIPDLMGVVISNAKIPPRDLEWCWRNAGSGWNWTLI